MQDYTLELSTPQLLLVREMASDQLHDVEELLYGRGRKRERTIQYQRGLESQADDLRTLIEQIDERSSAKGAYYNE